MTQPSFLGKDMGPQVEYMEDELERVAEVAPEPGRALEVDLGASRAAWGLPVVRIAAVATMLVWIVWGYYLIHTQRVLLAGFAAAVIVLSGAVTFLPIPFQSRVWLLSAGLFVGGLLGLVAWGWGGGALLLFVASVAAPALFLGARAGRITAILGALALLGYGVGSTLGVFGQATETERVEFLLAEWGAFVLVSFLIVRGMWAFSSSVESSLGGVRQEIWVLRDSRRALKANISELQRAADGLQRRASLLRESLVVARQLSMFLDLEALLERAPEVIAEHFNLYDVGIYLLDEQGEWALLRAAFTVEGKKRVLGGFRVRRGSEAPVAQAIEHKQAVAVEVGEGGATRKALERATVVIPLLVEGHPIGALELWGSIGVPFTQEELEAFSCVAAHLAVTIISTNRLGDQAAALEVASPFYRTLNDLAVAKTEQEVHQVILQALENSHPDRILIARQGDSVEDLQVILDVRKGHAGYGSRRADAPLPAALADALIVSMALDEPLWISDLSGLNSALSPELVEVLSELRGVGIAESLALLPLRLEGAHIVEGVLVLYQVPHLFSPREIRLHRVLSELCGAALERCRLLTEAQERFELGQRRVAVGEQLQNTLDPDAILQVTARELGRALGAEMVTVEVDPDISRRDTDTLESTEARS